MILDRDVCERKKALRSWEIILGKTGEKKPKCKVMSSEEFFHQGQSRGEGEPLRCRGIYYIEAVRGPEMVGRSEVAGEEGLLGWKFTVEEFSSRSVGRCNCLVMKFIIILTIHP